MGEQRGSGPRARARRPLGDQRAHRVGERHGRIAEVVAAAEAHEPGARADEPAAEQRRAARRGRRRPSRSGSGTRGCAPRSGGGGCGPRRARSGSQGASSGSSRPKSKTAKTSSGGSRSKSATASRSTASRSSKGSARKTTARKAAPRKSSSNRSTSQSSSNRSTASQNGAGNGGVVGTVKSAASKVSGPAVAIGATAVGVAGGLVLKGTRRQKTILGVPVPRKAPSVDVKKVAKTVGKASKQFGETSKSVSKDIERVGDQAEPSRRSQRRRDALAAGDAVLVEAPAPVGAAVVRAVLAADLDVARLRGLALGREDRVRVGDRADDLVRVDRLAAVERHAELALGAQRLQAVHVVGHGRLAGRLVEQVIVPARPRAAPAREHPRVGVQHRLVGLVGDRAEQLVLAVRGVGQQRQRLVGVRRHHDVVEALGRPPARRHLHVVVVARDRLDRRWRATAAPATRRRAPRT